MHRRSNKSWKEELPYWAALIFSAALLAIMLLPLVVPEPRPPFPFENRPQYGGVLRIDVPGPLGSLDPYGTASGYAMYPMQMMYNSLFRVDASGNMRPELACRWTRERDGRTWRLVLRRGVRFHTGRELTASDAAASIEAYAARKSPGLGRRIERMDTPDPYTLRLRLRRSSPFALNALADIPIVPQKALAGGNDTPPGTGPFRLQKRNGEKSVTLEAFPDYFEGRPYLAGVRFTYIPHWGDIWWRIFAEQTDAILDAEPANMKYFNMLPYLLQTRSKATSYAYVLVFNVRTPPVNDVRVRRAIACAIDPARLSENMAYPKAGSVGRSSPSRPALDLLCTETPYRPDRALALLAQAGWKDRDARGYLMKNGNRLLLRLLVPCRFTWEQHMAIRIMTQLYRLGIRTKWLRPATTERFHRLLREGRFDMVFSTICLRPSRPEFLFKTFHSHGEWNFGRYADPDTDRLLDRLLKSAPRKEADRIVLRIARRIREDRPAVFLGRKRLVSALSRYFGGVDHLLRSDLTRREVHRIYLKKGARPGSFQLLAYRRAAPRGFWTDKWTPLEVLFRTR